MTSNIDGDNDNMQATLEAQADELLKPYDGIYTDKQLQRKDREFKNRAESRQIVNAYVCEDFTELDNTLIESMIGDIKDAANRMHIDAVDLQMICLRCQKLPYSNISIIVGLSESQCFERLQIAQSKVASHDNFGLWEDIMEMQRCLGSNWYKMFRELMEYREEVNNGRR